MYIFSPGRHSQFVTDVVIAQMVSTFTYFHLYDILSV